jgi:hypothetical protein
LSLVYTTTRARTGHGRPDPAAPAAGAVYRLHTGSCRFASGPSAMPVTFEVWQVLVEHAGTRDDYLLCKVCRPEESESR